MKLSKDEFKKLQEYWYKLLADSGFEDIEKFNGDELVLKQSANYCYRKNDMLSRIRKENYYTRIGQAVYENEAFFRNEVDRLVMARHAEGAAIKSIVEELLSLGTPRDRLTVRYIIRKYQMIWGFKYFTPKELNLKA